MADLLLVGRVDVVDVADVDGRGETDLGIGRGHAALDVAHAGPAGLDRRVWRGPKSASCTTRNGRSGPPNDLRQSATRAGSRRA
jgi:hypothetical protein